MKINVMNSGAFTIDTIDTFTKREIRALYDKDARLVTAVYNRGDRGWTVAYTHTRVLKRLENAGLSLGPRNRKTAAQGF